MRKSFIYALLFLMACSFLAEAQNPSSARYMAPGDPNLNPNWDWTPNGAGYTMYYSNNGSTPIKLSNVQTPFYTSGHPLADALNNDKKDMWQQDGWMLAYKDFGTPTIAPAYPFFILYNKYRGILRVMFYNAPGDSYTAYKAELSFRSTSPKAALLTFTDQTKAVLNNYDGSKTETFLGKFTPYQDWAYADFVVAGYDPNLSNNAVFHLEFYGVDESQITLNSTEFTMSEVLSNANPSSSKSTSQTIKDALNQGQKFYKDVANATKGLKDAVAKETGNPWWKSIAKDISNSSITSMVPYVGGLLGFVTSFIGGKSTPAPREPMNFKGSLKLDGAITTTYPLLRVDLALSPGAQVADLYRPVQSIPWGIFNLTTAPKTQYNSYNYTDPDGFYSSTSYDGFLSENISYVLNPNIGMQLISVKKAGVYSFAKPTPLSTGNQLSSDFQTEQIGLEFTFKINTSTKNSDATIVIYKVYPASLSTSSHYYDHNCGCYNRRGNETVTDESLSISPNPFNESTAIRYHLKKKAQVSLKILDITGKEVITLVNKDEVEGSHITTWDGRSSDGTPQPNGIYVYRLTTGKEVYTRKIVLQK